jgi:hypothetical protein
MKKVARLGLAFGAHRVLASAVALTLALPLNPPKDLFS